MLTHDQIMKLKLTRFKNGEIVNVDTERKEGEIVFEQNSVHPEYYNLLRASGVLYGTLHYQGVALQQLIEVCKQVGATDLIPTLEQMKSPIEFALALAEHGVEAYCTDLKQ